MTDHTPSPWAVLLAELAAGTGFAHLFDGAPPAMVGFASALVVGVSLRLLDPLLRAHGERIAKRLTPPPAPPDDRTG